MVIYDLFVGEWYTFILKIGGKIMVQHFQRIHRRTGVPFNSMLFFDDEDKNSESVKMASNNSSSFILVGNGLNIGALRQGLTKFSQNSASSGNTKRN
ncbi:hypothetical protein PVL29_003696 [Vitis rotundifolia]|uniref:Uncharacterized protein n=1 Tax=Vitis rotundifolia TaxID=103349 RepID=A0AA39E3Y5_VITRO|nr:hypothetical protein PVL29_003696 [Vitis rotundifolia]